MQAGIRPLAAPQYLGRLVINATTIINARDYGQTIHDLAIRRHLILIGEDMVNVECATYVAD
jgi:replicative DNA helicase